MFSKIFKPYKTNDLIRLGPKEDGGYVVNKCAVINSDILISFGLGAEFRFEKNFRIFNNSRIFCYDHSVNLMFWIKFFCITLKQLCFELNFSKLKNYFIFFDYLFFFNSNKNFHIKKKIVSKKRKLKSEILFSEIFRSTKKNNIFLKIDIEGDEIFILKEILKYENRIYSLVIEFHNFFFTKKIIEKFINDLNFLSLTHIHGNNYGEVNKLGEPDVLEFTFLNFKKVNIFKKIKSLKKYPVKNLDFPNNPLEKDLRIMFSK
jgi:hypothetical protein